LIELFIKKFTFVIKLKFQSKMHFINCVHILTQHRQDTSDKNTFTKISFSNCHYFYQTLLL